MNRPPVPGPHPIPDPQSVPGGDGTGEKRDVRGFLRRAALFIGVGAAIYAGLYLASERLVYEYAERNRFHAVRMAPHSEYDAVILGASRAAVFDYRDMNQRLEVLTGARILNLATVGAGVVVNRLLLDYFLTERTTRTVVYVLDSFAFYSSEWNEERLGDASLFRRAPWDPVLARRLLTMPGARQAGFEYLTGFQKINNPDRFEPDLFPAEGAAFDRTYRPVPQIDRQRLEFLYPGEVGAEALRNQPYLEEFASLIRSVQERGMRVVVIRPPLPERMYEMIPGEAEFEAAARAMVEALGAEFHDFTRVGNDPEYFHDSDHLNQTGVLAFFENHLAELIAVERGTP